VFGPDRGLEQFIHAGIDDESLARVGHLPEGKGLLLLAIATESTGSIGFEPQIRFSGPVDSVVDDDVLEDLVAVLREALANVARHAEASHPDVSGAPQDAGWPH
jgi:signal transduction histidine kinase